MQQTLFDFAQHTRHTENEMATQPSHIAQKYLVCHVALVPTEVAFDCISGNYNAMALRTHNPPLKMYSKLGKVHIPTFVELCKNIQFNLPSGQKLPAYTRFHETLYPKPENVETWQWLSRPDQWKHAGAFIAMTLNPSTQYGQLMDELDSDRHALRKYLTSTSREEKIAIAEDVGKLVSSIQLPSTFYLHNVSCFSSFPSPSPKEKEKEELNNPTSLVPSPQGKEQEITLQSLRPKMEAYRTRAGLSKTISTKRLAQQVLASALQFQSVPVEILARHQKELPKLTEDEMLVATQLIDALHLHEHDLLDTESSPRCMALIKSTANKNWNARNMMQCIVHPEKYIDNARHLQAYQKLVSTSSNNDPVLVEVIKHV